MKKSLKLLPLILIVLGFGLSNCNVYNNMVTMREEADKSWSNVDTQMQRRNDLIPNLVETVKGYATHESAIFTEVAESRSKLSGAATQSDKIKAYNEQSGALARLLAIAENYPDLKANQNFIGLQDELAGTENRISVARQRYNEAAKDYNAYIQQFPQLIIARWLNFQKRPYFEAPEEAKKVPQVKF
jgi:LemA protein